MRRGLGQRIARSALFVRLTKKAAAYARDPERLKDLLTRATAKANAAGGRGVLTEIWESLLALFRLLRAYARGDYRNVSARHVVLITAGILYFLMPVDLIPDVLLGVGFIDDVAILAWIVSTVSGALDDFRRWESRSEAGAPDESAGGP